MLPFFRVKTQKDFCDKLLGKTRKYRLSRHGAAVAVTGRLLAYYRREAVPDGLMPPAAGRVERFAILLSALGRFVVAYAVSYPESEDIAGRQEYVHVCPSLDAVRDFLAAMHYPDKGEFADAALVQAAKTLAGGGRTAVLATETRCQRPDTALDADDEAALPTAEPDAPVEPAGVSDVSQCIAAAMEAGILPAQGAPGTGAATGPNRRDLTGSEAAAAATDPAKQAP